MSKKLSKFDAADSLRDAEAIAEYMAAAFETQDPSYVSHALGVVARAKGISEIARESGLSREHLYRSFSKDGNPTLRSILAVLEALGVQLSATAAEHAGRHDSGSVAERQPAAKKVARQKPTPKAKGKPASRAGKKAAA